MSNLRLNFDPENYSIWSCEYKHPTELSFVHMSGAIIEETFKCLKTIRDYAFGSVCLFGENNDSTISGIWIWR